MYMDIARALMPTSDTGLIVLICSGDFSPVVFAWFVLQALCLLLPDKLVR